MDMNRPDLAVLTRVPNDFLIVDHNYCELDHTHGWRKREGWRSKSGHVIRLTGRTDLVDGGRTREDPSSLFLNVWDVVPCSAVGSHFGVWEETRDPPGLHLSFSHGVLVVRCPSDVELSGYKFCFQNDAWMYDFLHLGLRESILKAPCDALE